MNDQKNKFRLLKKFWYPPSPPSPPAIFGGEIQIQTNIAQKEKSYGFEILNILKMNKRISLDPYRNGMVYLGMKLRFNQK